LPARSGFKVIMVRHNSIVQTPVGQDEIADATNKRPSQPNLEATKQK